MINDNFKLYKSFHHLEEAKSFSEFLEENNIENSLETIGNVFDTSISGKAAIANYLIKIDAQNFEKVNAILIESVKHLSKEDLEAHHLNLLDDNELKEIFVKPDEWATEDVEIARQILVLRNFIINEDEVTKLKQKRISEIREGKKGNLLLMLLTFLAITLGLFTFLIFIPGGIGTAYYYTYGKSTDTEGKNHPTFDTQTREIGKIILFLGTAIFIIEAIFLLYFLN